MSEEPVVEPSSSDELWERGAEMIKAVYAGNVTQLPKGTMPFFDVMLETLFAQVWTRPELSVRDRRLLVMGVIAAFGQVDTWKLQVASALANGELTPTEVRETLVTLAPYAGYPNVAALTGPTEQTIAQASEG